jgi:hypothetical protein
MTTRNNIKIVGTLAISLLCLGSFQTFGKDAATPKPAQAALSSVPAAELPAQAAKLIQEAKVRQREARTIEVVKAALALNPAAAPGRWRHRSCRPKWRPWPPGCRR